MLTTAIKPDLRAIADSVRKTAEHLDIERNVAAGRQRIGELTSRLRELCGDDNREAHATEITSVDREIKELEEGLRPVRLRLIELRAEHGDRVALALRPHRLEAARDLLDAILEARPLVRRLAEVSALIERSGGPTTGRVADWTAGAELAVRRLLPSDT